MNNIYRSGVSSLFIQILTGSFDIYVLSMKFKPSLLFIKNLLWIELLVQAIEATFYIWLVTSFSKIKNITPFRYYDWIITTPSMLFTYTMYLFYVKYNHEKKDEKPLSLYSTAEENLSNLIPIFILNTMMLGFGYLAEIGKITYNAGAILGFIPFFMMFYLIYDNYAKYTIIGQITFIYFSGIWALYGIASLLSYKYKNTIYNILDLFSKNFFGLFLALVLIFNKE